MDKQHRYTLTEGHVIASGHQTWLGNPLLYWLFHEVFYFWKIHVSIGEDQIAPIVGAEVTVPGPPARLDSQAELLALWGQLFVHMCALTV